MWSNSVLLWAVILVGLLITFLKLNKVIISESSTSFKDNEGNTYNIQGSINCKTVGVIYCILCTECEKYIYVGQTGDKFYQRMLLNFSKIRTQKVEDPVAKHFCQKNHCVKNFKVIGIEKTGNGDKIYRETKESLWIKKLKTFEPLGLNIKLDRH